MAHTHGPTMPGIPHREMQFVNRSLEELLEKAKRFLSTIIQSIWVDMDEIKEKICPVLSDLKKGTTTGIRKGSPVNPYPAPHS